MSALHTALFRAQQARIRCSECGRPLPDPAFRFGPVGKELCWECHSGEALPDTDEMREAIRDNHKMAELRASGMRYGVGVTLFEKVPMPRRARWPREGDQ